MLQALPCFQHLDLLVSSPGQKDCRRELFLGIIHSLASSTEIAFISYKSLVCLSLVLSKVAKLEMEAWALSISLLVVLIFLMWKKTREWKDNEKANIGKDSNLCHPD